MNLTFKKKLFVLIFIFIIVLFVSGCSKGEEPEATGTDYLSFSATTEALASQEQAGSDPLGLKVGTDYYSEFEQHDDWDFFGKYDEEEYDITNSDNGLSVSLNNPIDVLFGYYLASYTDVSISSAFEYVEGDADVKFTLICRSGSIGEYEFSIDTLNYFYIFFYDAESGEYTIIDAGELDKVDIDFNSFTMRADCIQESLDLYVNDVLVSSVVDSKIKDGINGFSFESYDDKTAKLIFNNIDIELINE